jgi:glutamine synthetase
MTNNIFLTEYIWIDGTNPVANIRSKTKTLSVKDGHKVTLADFSDWSFDGSSTNQATGDNSDCILKPVNFVTDPIRGVGNYLVLCEVFNVDGTIHESNTRAFLRKQLENEGAKQNPWVGFEQEYTLINKENNLPLGWPSQGFPAPQGPYYCGVGSDKICGRDIAEEHLQACINAGIMIYGINAEVMLGQWEFQIGYRGDDNEVVDALNISDHTWLARWLLIRIAEPYGVVVNIDNKPVKGNWNGSGMHTNFSTNATRDPKNGLNAIKEAIDNLANCHQEHIKLYGHLLSERLTGEHETSDISNFSAATANRGSSIRIPKPVEINGYGYFEDRRPGSNSDPYLVAGLLVKNVCTNNKKLAKAS